MVRDRDIPVHARAFTLIELIVVSILLVVLAGLILPRILQSSNRAERAEIQQVERMLGLMAHRDASATSPMALQIRQTDGASILELLTLRRNDSSLWADAEWKLDPLATPVRLEHNQIEVCSLDGVVQPENAWRISLVPGAPRPHIALVFRPLKSGNPTTVVLEPFSTAAFIATSSADAEFAALPRRAEDLDDVGLGSAPW